VKEISATEAARRFSELLDDVEHRGESFLVKRRGHAVARIGPATAATWGDLVTLLREYPPDPEWARDIAEVRALLTLEDQWSD
jgi:antitoxin (DNA-binding transcriptional repressor) of toxin-antitoxin stability system